MLPVLDNDHLRALVAIAETGSFTKAADIVHKTQSAVSMQIRRLEERLGREIFVKDGRAARLTPEGERLLDYAYRILRLSDEALAHFRTDTLTGSVKLGVPDDYAERYLPQTLPRFNALHPQAEVTVVCEPTSQLVAQVQANEIDLAIITHTPEHGLGEIIREEKLLWVSSARQSIHCARPLPLALGRDTCIWRKAALAALERVAMPHRVLYTSWSSTAVGAMIQSGLAVSVLAESALRTGMRVLGPEEGFPLLAPVKIALLRNPRSRTHLTRALAELIVQCLDNLSGPERLQVAE